MRSSFRRINSSNWTSSRTIRRGVTSEDLRERRKSLIFWWLVGIFRSRVPWVRDESKDCSQSLHRIFSAECANSSYIGSEKSTRKIESPVIGFFLLEGDEVRLYPLRAVFG